MQEYIRVRKDEYEELKQIKEGIETIKSYGLPDDTQFILMTKQDFDRNQKQYDELLKIRAEFYSNKSKYIKNEKQDLKEWLEEEIKRITIIDEEPINDGETFYLGIINAYKKVLERLG
jgi:hypothetical protein